MTLAQRVLGPDGTRTDLQSLRSSADLLAVDTDAVRETIRPFVSKAYELDDPAWRNVCLKHHRRVRKDYMRRLLRSLVPGFSVRDQAQINAVYSERWERDQFKPFAIPPSPSKGTPYEWQGRGLLLANAGARRARVLYLMRLVEALRPRSVLEVGFGEGVNLALLAARFPDVEFAGIEFTQGGVAAARSLQNLASLPPELIEFSPERPLSADRHRSIDFRLGTAAKLPWSESGFDMIFTSLALEQMEQIREQALREIARVARRHVVMIEPFREFNASGLRRRYIVAHDYFRGSIADLKSFALSPIAVLDHMPAKVTLKPVVVVCEKREPGTPFGET